MQNLWEELIGYARWSASPHNVQPWKVKIISKTEAELYYEPKRLLPVEDFNGCFITLGFGVFIENMSIAASKYGMKVTEDFKNVKLDENKSEPTFFTALKIENAKDKSLLDRELIKKRRTSRLPFDNKYMDKKILTKLNEISKEYGYEFNFSTDKETVDWVLNLNCDTLFYDMGDKKTRDEVGSWLRYSRKQAQEKKDGLSAYCMNLPAILMYLAFNLPGILNFPVVSQLLKKRYLQTTSGTTTVGWLSGPFKKPSDWIRAGHMMARLWAQMTEDGIYLHPFGSIITNKKSHHKFVEKFKVDENTNPIWLLVRLGYSDLPPRSERIEVKDILIK